VLYIPLEKPSGADREDRQMLTAKSENPYKTKSHRASLKSAYTQGEENTAFSSQWRSGGA